MHCQLRQTLLGTVAACRVGYLAGMSKLVASIFYLLVILGKLHNLSDTNLLI